MQRIAEEELQASLAEMGPGLNADSGALVLIDNATGTVRAMVGGPGWSEGSQFNRAWQSVRQPGSSFKPFVYAAALLQGMTPDSLVADTPATFGDWSPRNFDGEYRGNITLRQALQESRNVVSARLAQQVGPERVVQLAQELGIQESIEPNLTIALGAVDVSPLSMASAFSTFASGGIARMPLAVTRVTAATGERLSDMRPSAGKRVLPPDVSQQMTQMLMSAVKDGTGKAAQLENIDVAGKTGTTDESRDAWFVGYTPEYTLAVWIGNDDHSPMLDVFGGGMPAIIWNRVMSRIAEGGVKQKRFTFANVEKSELVRVCPDSRKLPTASCPDVRPMRFAPGTIPDDPCPVHKGESAERREAPVSAPPAAEPASAPEESAQEPAARGLEQAAPSPAQEAPVSEPESAREPVTAPAPPQEREARPVAEPVRRSEPKPAAAPVPRPEPPAPKRAAPPPPPPPAPEPPPPPAPAPKPAAPPPPPPAPEPPPLIFTPAPEPAAPPPPPPQPEPNVPEQVLTPIPPPQ